MANMPSVPVYDLQIHPRDRELIAATHGRSFWIVDIAPLSQLNSRVMAANAFLFEPKPAFAWAEEPLRRFVSEAGVSLAVLAHTSGRLLAQAGFARAMDVRSACVLAAATNATSAELGRLVDGAPFRELHYAGATLTDASGKIVLTRGRLFGDTRHLAELARFACRTVDALSRAAADWRASTSDSHAFSHKARLARALWISVSACASSALAS